MAWRPPPEITAPVDLCSRDGTLNPAARGWARRPLLRGPLPRPFLRRKRWNFVFVSNPDVLVAAALSDADYIGLGFVWLYDLRQRRFLEQEHLSPLATGVTIGETVDAPAAFRSGPFTYTWTPTEGGRMLDIRVAAPRLKGSEQALDLRLRVELADSDSFNLVVPWSDRQFNYTGKLVALPAEGELRVGGDRYALSAGDTLASIDCTRGIWPYHTVWRWASGAGRVDGRRVGVNFGAGWTESTGVLENVLYADGKVYPLWEPIDFAFDVENLSRPWRLRTPDSDRVDLTFTPVYQRAQDTNLMLLRIQLQQVMGHFAGRIVLDGGQVLELSGLPGIAENHLARW